MDGASQWRLYRHVIFPQLSPVALSALIIVGHMSMKVFDLIMAIAGRSELTRGARHPDVASYSPATTPSRRPSATSCCSSSRSLIVPYLVYTNRQERAR